MFANKLFEVNIHFLYLFSNQLFMEIVINTTGSQLEKKEGMLCIKLPDGFSESINPALLERLVVTQGTSITVDALLMALEYEVDIVFANHTGAFHARVWHGKYSSVADIRKGQALFSVSAESINWMRDLMKDKLTAQAGLLKKLKAEDAELLDLELATVLTRLQAIDTSDSRRFKSSLAGIEGSFAKFYFQLLSQSLPEAYRFKGRSRQPAQDVFNCLLNYTYGMFYQRLERALIKAGLDPLLGVLHSSDYNTPALAFDCIEVFRCFADEAVCLFLKQEGIEPTAFDTSDGFYLNHAGKKKYLPWLALFMDENINYHRRRLSRTGHIQHYANRLAERMLSFYKRSQGKAFIVINDPINK